MNENQITRLYKRLESIREKMTQEGLKYGLDHPIVLLRSIELDSIHTQILLKTKKSLAKEEMKNKITNKTLKQVF